MKKLDMIKGGVELLVGTGVSILVGGAIAKVRPAQLSAIKKLAVGSASIALGMMATDTVTAYVDEKFDETVNNVKDAIKYPVEYETTEPEVEAN